MTIIFVALLAVCVGSEQAGNPALAKLGVDQTASATQAGGTWRQGDALRRGEFGAVGDRDDRGLNGSVNSMHDSFTPIGGSFRCG